MGELQVGGPGRHPMTGQTAGERRASTALRRGGVGLAVAGAVGGLGGSMLTLGRGKLPLTIAAGGAAAIVLGSAVALRNFGDAKEYRGGRVWIKTGNFTDGVIKGAGYSPDEVAWSPTLQGAFEIARAADGRNMIHRYDDGQYVVQPVAENYDTLGRWRSGPVAESVRDASTVLSWHEAPVFVQSDVKVPDFHIEEAGRLYHIREGGGYPMPRENIRDVTPG